MLQGGLFSSLKNYIDRYFSGIYRLLKSQALCVCVFVGGVGDGDKFKNLVK